MLSVRAAASLLADASGLPGARALLRVLGFVLPPLPVDARLRDALGLGGIVRAARLLPGASGHRALAAEVAADVPMRDGVRAVAAALERHAGDGAWLACLVGADATTLAAWTSGPRGLRVAALTTQRDAVSDADADTVRTLAAHAALAPGTHARWLDILGRDAVSARFYRAFERGVRRLADSARGHAPPDVRHELALLTASRLLFLAFLEAKGWLDDDRGFLLRTATTALTRGAGARGGALRAGTLHERWLRPLCFGTLNTPPSRRAPAARAFGRVPFLNGGLFTPTPTERRHRALRFPDDALVAFVGEVLDRFRFTAREDAADWSEAAIDPEMLGRTFESLMAERERRGSGSFYTPPALVERVVDEALAALPAGAEALTAVRVLDPACGSGAFLVHVLERLTAARRAAGDTRPLHRIRRDVLAHNVFGVDRNPVAVWLCELRLWLAVVIDCDVTDPLAVPPLPNLDHHIRVGDALAGGDFRHAPPAGRRLAALRTRYVRAVGARKRHLAAALDREERRRALAESARALTALDAERRALLARLRTRDLFGDRPPPSSADRQRLRTLRATRRAHRAAHRRLEAGGALPFRFAAHVADVGAAGGFDLVVGNPPWVRPHRLPAAERARLRADFAVLREAAWRAGAARAAAGRGFGGQGDLAAAFVERGVRLLRPGGVLGLLVPAKLWRTLAGGGVRRFLAAETRVCAVHDLTRGPAAFDAATYPSVVIAQREAATSAPTRDAPSGRVTVCVARGRAEHAFTLPRSALPLGGDPGAPWVLLPPGARAAFDAVRRAGPPLGDAGLGRPTLGVKCGHNAAFLVRATEHGDELATIRGAPDRRTSTVERRSLRPALAGHAVGRAEPASDGLRIVWTHDALGQPLRALPPHTARWLRRFRPRLEARRDAGGRRPWWALYRTDAARTGSPRLVWADFGRQLRSTVLDAGDPTVPLNTCYVLATPSLEDAWALDALLTSPVADAWLDVLAEPARGGWKRFLGWTVAALPVPARWTHVRPALAALGRRRALGDPPGPDEHRRVVVAAFGLTERDVAPLLAWRCAGA
jgi:hypothetical protein